MSSQRPRSNRPLRPVSRTGSSAPLGGSGLSSPRRQDRLPLTIAAAVAIIALVLAGTMVATAIRGFGNGSSNNPSNQLDAPSDAAFVGASASASSSASAAGAVSSGASSAPSASAENPDTVSTNDAGLPSASQPAASGIPSADAANALPTTGVATAQTNRPYTVCLDPGHGGIDLGYTRLSADGSQIVMEEKTLTLQIAQQTKKQLEAEGVNVVMTRTTDQLVNDTGADVNDDGKKSDDADNSGKIDNNGDSVDELDELQARVNVCNEAHADLMISIHINGADNTALQGYEAWWAKDRPFSDKSQWFAEEAVTELGKQLGAAGFSVESRGAHDDTATDIPDADVPKNAFQHYIMLSPDVPDRDFHGTTMPGAIVETLFLSNDNDYQILSDPAGPAAISNAYVAAVNGYIAQFPEEGKTPPRGVPANLAATPEAANQRATNEAASATPDMAATHGSATPGDVPQVGQIPASGPGNPPRPPVPAFADYQSSHVVQGGVPDSKEIALTFDCGADRGYAENILDLLDQDGLKGSFGMTGKWAEANPDLVKRMAKEGHMIFNHTYSHQSFTGFSTQSGDPGTQFRVDELDHANQAIMDITGGYDTRPYWRPPYGDLGPQTLIDAAGAGYPVTVLWSVDTFGWDGYSVDQITQRTMDGLDPGEIVLMHVGGQSEDFHAMPGIIQQAKAQGYTFVTVEQMFADGSQATPEPSDSTGARTTGQLQAVLPEEVDGARKIR